MAEEKKGFFSRLKEGLTKTRDNIVAGIDAVFYGASEIDDDFYEELEEILIMGDIGVNATNDIIERMKEEVKRSICGIHRSARSCWLRVSRSRCVSERPHMTLRRNSLLFLS